MGRDTEQPVTVAGRQLRCLVCGHATFRERRGQMSGRFMSFVDLEWLQPSATCYVCAGCGHVHWFMPTDRA